jgi:hypothetical protein
MSLQTLGLQELSTNEQVETNGRGVFIAVFALRYTIGKYIWGGY